MVILKSIHKRSLGILSIILVGISILFVFVTPSQYLSEKIQNLAVYGFGAGGLILEIFGFMVFMMIERKASFGSSNGGRYDGGDVTVDGKPLEKNEHLVVRNIKYEKRAIDLVVIGLSFQLFGLWFGLEQFLI